MDHIFHALSHQTRRAMLHRLASGPATVSELAAPFQMTLAAASRHIKVLEDAELIRREVNWRTHLCHLNVAPLAQAHAEIGRFEAFWTERLDILERLLRDEDAEKARRVESDHSENPTPRPERKKT